MTLPAILDPFAKGAAATVMVRMALEWLIDHDALDHLFDVTAQSQYTRELTLGHLVDLMLDVAAGIRPSPRAAFAARHPARNPRPATGVSTDARGRQGLRPRPLPRKGTSWPTPSSTATTNASARAGSIAPCCCSRTSCCARSSCSSSG